MAGETHSFCMVVWSACGVRKPTGSSGCFGWEQRVADLVEVVFNGHVLTIALLWDDEEIPSLGAILSLFQVM